MDIITARCNTFDTGKPARSNICMVLDDKGRQILDTLELTGKQTVVEIFGEKVSMIEVKHSYGTDEVCEDFLWQ